MVRFLVLTLSILSLGGLLCGCPGDYRVSVPDTHPAHRQARPAPPPELSDVLAIHSPTPDPVPPEMKREKKGMMHP